MTDKNLVDKDEYRTLVDESYKDMAANSSTKSAKSQRLSIFGPRIVPLLLVLLLANIVLYFVFQPQEVIFTTEHSANEELKVKYPEEYQELTEIDNFFTSDWEFSTYQDRSFKDAVESLNANLAEDEAPYPVSEFKYDQGGLYYISKD